MRPGSELRTALHGEAWSDGASTAYYGEEPTAAWISAHAYAPVAFHLQPTACLLPRAPRASGLGPEVTASTSPSRSDGNGAPRESPAPASAAQRRPQTPPRPASPDSGAPFRPSRSWYHRRRPRWTTQPRARAWFPR